MPPIIIFAGAYYLRRHFKNDLDSNITFALLSSSYLNDKLRLKYLNILIDIRD